MPAGSAPSILSAPQAADTETFEEIHSTENAAHVRDVSGHIDVDNQCAVFEQGQYDYETIAASQTAQVLGVTGAAGDFLHQLIIVPATTGAGPVSIKDGSGSSINVFVAGTLADLRPIVIPFNIVSTGGAWSVTTGANVSVIATGRFTA